MNADGTGVRTRHQARRRQRFPAWSPDGKSLAFQSNAGGAKYEIYTVAGRRRSPPDDHVAIDAIQPAWTPDGTTIAFARDGAIWYHRDRQGDAADLGKGQRLRAGLAARPAEVGSHRHGDRRPARHAGHEGRRVRLPPRPAARAGRGRRARRRRRVRAAGRGRTSHTTRWPRPPARTRGARGEPATGARRSTAMGRGAAEVVAAPARGGPARRHPRASAAPATPRSPRSAMRALPVGVPKLIVSTVASGDTRPVRRRDGHRR